MEPQYGTTGDLLRDRGQIHVSSRAATEYAEFRRLMPEEARRELTRLLVDARLVRDGTWRRRSKPEAVDITAHVVQEGDLQIVTHVSVRPLNQGRASTRHRRREV